jgi:hypothetical protein
MERSTTVAEGQALAGASDTTRGATPGSGDPTPRSRRMLLASGLGAAVGFVASALGHPREVRAGSDGDVVLGSGPQNETATTWLQNQSNGSDVLWGTTTGSGTGVYGRSVSGTGVWADSTNGNAINAITGSGSGVFGQSTSGKGIYGLSTDGNGGYFRSTSKPGIYSESSQVDGIQGNSFGTSAYAGVHGYSQPGTAMGVLGVSSSAIGVKGQSSTNDGVYGVTTSGAGVRGESQSSDGVHGNSATGQGVAGASNSGFGVLGVSTSGTGVGAASVATDQPGMSGWSQANSTGVVGYSSSAGGTLPAARAKTGVFGQATQDSSSRGVLGISTSGQGVRGESTSGAAVYATTTSGYAFRGSGRIRFDKVSGQAAIAANTSSIVITPGIDITTDSFVLLTPEVDLGSRRLWFTKDTTNNRFTIHLSSSSASTITIAWLLLN